MHADNFIFQWVMVVLILITYSLTLILPLSLLCCSSRDLPTISPREEDLDDHRLHSSARTISFTAFGVYAIVSLEQTIARNRLGDTEKDWTFGQIIALFLLIGTANELLNLLLSSLNNSGE